MALLPIFSENDIQIDVFLRPKKCKRLSLSASATNDVFSCRFQRIKRAAQWEQQRPARVTSPSRIMSNDRKKSCRLPETVVPVKYSLRYDDLDLDRCTFTGQVVIDCQVGSSRYCVCRLCILSRVLLPL